MCVETLVSVNADVCGDACACEDASVYESV